MTATLSNRYPGAVLFSALLHGGLVALLLLLSYVVQHRIKESPRIIELVAGEGDNFGATEAPALGTPGGIKVNVSPPVKSEPVPAAPAAPLEAVPVPKPVDPVGKIASAIRSLEKKVAKIRADERKTMEEQARAPLTKEQFDKLNKGRSATTAKASPPAKIPKVGAGIAKGVAGGSAANTTGGAGGKALVRDDGDLMEAYQAMFKQRLRAALEPPSGLSDSLVAKVAVTIAASGALSGARITASSGKAEFDQAVLDAVGRMRMPETPDHKSVVFELGVRLQDIGGG